MTAGLSSEARIGITGARGILGSRIAEACGALRYNPVPYGGDVRDGAALTAWVKDLDAVVHAAAVVPVSVVEADPGNAIAVNVGGTAAVARAAADRDLPFTYVSTSHVYEPSSDPLVEGSSLRPVNKYGLTKLQGEAWCEVLHSSPLLVRVFSFFDARQPEPYLVPTLRRRVAETGHGQELAVHSAGSTRDLADASWMATAIARLVAAGATGRVNCATGVAVPVADVARAVAAAQGRHDVRVVDATPGRQDHLVADTTLLRHLIPDLRPFDLSQALTGLCRD